MEKLVKEINNLDYLHEYSDDHELYIKESQKKNNIEIQLNKLASHELNEIESKLDIVGKHNWKRYFFKQN